MDLIAFATERTPALLRYATALSGDPHLAEDLVQDVLLKAQRRWSLISALEVPEAYVRRMITNEFLSWSRRKAASVVPLPPEELASSAPNLADPSTRIDEIDAMRVELAKLPRKQRAVLALRYYVCLPDGEIAKMLGCSAGTVRSHASRALATLRASHIPMRRTM